MLKAKEIKLTRVEGPTGHCGTRTVTGIAIWAVASSVLHGWSHTAPGAPGRYPGGYDKCDFWITFEDGFVYSGRYDLVHFSKEMPNLAKHLRENVEFYSGQKCPAHLTQDAYNDIIASNPPSIAREMKRIMETYQIGDETLYSLKGTPRD